MTVSGQSGVGWAQEKDFDYGSLKLPDNANLVETVPSKKPNDKPTKQFRKTTTYKECRPILDKLLSLLESYYLSQYNSGVKASNSSRAA
jgi:hypothetical protein